MGAGLREVDWGLTIQSLIGHSEKSGFYIKLLKILKLGSGTIWFTFLKDLAGYQVTF